MIRRKFMECIECGVERWIYAKKMCQSCYSRQLVRKPIRKVSSKQRDALKDYSKVRDEFLSENRVCQARVKCKSLAINNNLEVHHKAGRIGKNLTDKSKFLAVCRKCHEWIENNPEEAKKRGFSMNRLN